MGEVWDDTKSTDSVSGFDGVLQSLHLGALVTEEPEGQVRRRADYLKVPWLVKKYAITVLPSVSSLCALRHFAKASLGPSHGPRGQARRRHAGPFLLRR